MFRHVLHVQVSENGFSYPASLCTSVNDEVIHSIPGSRVLQEGEKYPLDKIVYVCYNSQLAAAVTNCCTVLSRNHQIRQPSFEKGCYAKEGRN